MSDMRILVTGGAGFIGSSLCESLVLMGHKVVAIDSMFRGSEDNLDAILGSENFSLYAGDVRDIDDLDTCVEALGGLDLVYHLAAINGTKWFHEAAHSVIDVNVNGTLRTLELAMAHDAKYVFASSPEAFGEPLSQPISDGDAMVFTDPREHQRHSYGGSKYLGEIACQHAARDGLDVQIIRPFNTYGPRLCGDEYGQVIAMFFNQLIDSGVLSVHGDGSQTRDFVYVEDIAKANLLSMESESTFSFLNIGTGISTSIRKLAEIMIELSGKQLELTFDNLPEGDIKNSLAEISYAKKLINWNHETSLKNGLKNSFFKN